MRREILRHGRATRGRLRMTERERCGDDMAVALLLAGYPPNHYSPFYSRSYVSAYGATPWVSGGDGIVAALTGRQASDPIIKRRLELVSQ
jgi:hypothetical protein